MDQESKDANSLLVELDRGLKSQNIGDQSEAVVRFTNLFQRYPLPILINSACLKLAEAFRVGSNFIRVQICEVFERNQSHLNKIYNIDDFYRNIFTVTTSNDPIARSITLLTLGNIAPIVSEYKSIHHCISSSLESSIECELNATIACAARYVKQSSEFACNIYPKIISIIENDKTSTEVKIRALSVLDHGYYNANDAMVVNAFLINVIKNSRLTKLICTCLTLSTRIAYTSLTLINLKIELLLKTFSEEERRPIKLCALKNLKFLAEKCPHIWQTDHIEPLVSHLEAILKCNCNELSYDDDHTLCIIMRIFCKLLTCKCNFISEEEKTRIFQKCHQLALDCNNVSICSLAFELLTVMWEEHSHSSTSNMIEYESSNLTTDIFAAIKSFLIKATTFTKPLTRKDLRQTNHSIDETLAVTSSKTIYCHIVKLCRLNSHFCPELLKLVFTRISSKDVAMEDLSPYLTEFMCAIYQTTTEQVISLDNCWKLIKTKSHEMSETNLLNLCVLYFQIATRLSTHNIVHQLVDKVTQDHSTWFGFKVMRQAMRYGHFEIAELICQQLHENISNDTIDFYFSSMTRICSAEALLSDKSNLESNLKKALPVYEESISPLRASIGNLRTTDFQLQYLWLRIRTLRAHSQLRQCCKIYEVNPISYTVLLMLIDSNQNSTSTPGYLDISIVHQMPKIAKEFRNIADFYENLSIVSFNCDNESLDYINLLKCSCTMMADLLDAIFQYGRKLPIINKLPPPINPDSRRPLEHQEFEKTCSKLIESINSEVVDREMKCSEDTIEPLIELIKTCSNEILECPIAFPRYFFQALQMIQIKLAITPQPCASGGAIALYLNANENLVLKIEGLIQNMAKKQKVTIRNVAKVHTTVSMGSVKPNETNCNLKFQSVAIPHDNYFKTEFLLPLKWVGMFHVDIEVSIIDEQERLWKTGPTERITVQIN